MQIFWKEKNCRTLEAGAVIKLLISSKEVYYDRNTYTFY